MKQSILLADNITKIYNYQKKNAVTALKNIHLEIFSDDFICIMGPSGSGKTTLVNNLSTIDTPTAGRVYINGQATVSMDDNQISKFRSDYLGFIFQNFNLIDSLTLRENIRIPLMIKSITEARQQQLTDYYSSMLGINDILDKYPYECSTGQQQRCAIVRTLVTEPKLIIADEPTGNLDSRNSHDILQLLKNINEQQQVAVLLVSHDPMIASYSKKVLYINDGIIESIIERENMDQKQYFSKIVNLNFSQYHALFE